MSAKKTTSSVLLEVDRSIIEDKLLLQENREESFEDLIHGRAGQGIDDVPWKLVKPSPGMCVKTRTRDGQKVFVNICHAPEITAPEDISEKKLLTIWASEDQPLYRVPMSIGDGHEEADKSGIPVTAYDVAINPEFFKKIEKSKVFLRFVLTVVIEGIKEKYQLDIITEDYVILKHRKVLGELLQHRVRKGDPQKPATPLIQELSPPIPTSGRTPEYRIRHEPPDAEMPEYLLGEFTLDDVASSQGLTLDVGEDRIILDSPGRVGQQAYKLDVFIPFSVDQDECTATFNTDTKILTLKMPVVAAQ